MQITPNYRSQLLIFIKSVIQGDMKCVDMVKTHFPPMHEVGMEAFDPQAICDADFAVCGATHPPTEPHPTRPLMF